MIAVYVNAEGIVASLSENGSIRIYNWNDSKWEVKNEFLFSVDTHTGISEARKNITKMVDNLGECKVFIAKEVAGQLYYVLETNGFSIYELEGNPEQFMNLVWEEEQTQTKSEDKPAKLLITTPEQTEREGVFYINLKKALLSDCTLTSKKILLPFLRTIRFNCLEVDCDHLPRWFETEFQALGLNSTVTKISENHYKVSITTTNNQLNVIGHHNQESEVKINEIV